MSICECVCVCVCVSGMGEQRQKNKDQERPNQTPSKKKDRKAHLVDGHDNWAPCSLCGNDALLGLLHDAVIGRHHENNNVRDVGTSPAHIAKGGVAGGVNKCNVTVLRSANLEGADSLRNSARLA